MSKVFFRRNTQSRDEYKLLTRRYFKFVNTRVKETDIEIFRILDTHLDCCVELFRHSLCIAFNIESTIAYSFLEPLAKPCAVFLSEEYAGTDLSLASRKALVQICMHCIIKARNHAEGVLANV